MRNWHPYLTDTLAEMSRAGVRRAVGVLAAAQRSYSGCTAVPRERPRRARRAGQRAAPPPKSPTCATGTSIPASSRPTRITSGRRSTQLPPDVRDDARLVFTAHSIPVSMAERYPYEAQLRASARLVARAVGPPDWTLVYQSRSGRPAIPGSSRTSATTSAANTRRDSTPSSSAPIGFLCDHIEVLYDLDVEAAEMCREIGMAMARAEAVNTHPRFIDALADAVMDVLDRYEPAGHCRWRSETSRSIVVVESRQSRSMAEQPKLICFRPK